MQKLKKIEMHIVLLIFSHCLELLRIKCQNYSRNSSDQFSSSSSSYQSQKIMFTIKQDADAAQK